MFAFVSVNFFYHLQSKLWHRRWIRRPPCCIKEKLFRRFTHLPGVDWKCWIWKMTDHQNCRTWNSRTCPVIRSVIFTSCNFKPCKVQIGPPISRSSVSRPAFSAPRASFSVGPTGAQKQRRFCFPSTVTSSPLFSRYISYKLIEFWRLGIFW